LNVHPNILEIIRQIDPTYNNLHNQQMFEQMIIPSYGFGFIAHIAFESMKGLAIMFLQYYLKDMML
jgi:hypothetical protein